MSSTKKYLDYDGLSNVADKIKERLQKVTTMPASPSNGDAVLYIGTTTENYTRGLVYIYNSSTESWEHSTQPINLEVPITMLSGTKLTVESALQGLNTEKPSPVELTQEQYNALTPAQKRDRSKIYYVTDGSGGGGSTAEWGDIEGTLSNQTDLQNALNSKYDSSDSLENNFGDNDYFPLYDNSASTTKKTRWSNIKTKLKAFFDTIYTSSEGTENELRDTVGWTCKNRLPYPIGMRQKLNSDGSITDDANSYLSNYIEIKQVSYRFSGYFNASAPGPMGVMSIAYYNSQKEYLTIVQYPLEPGTNINILCEYPPIPEGTIASFIRISFDDSSSKYIQNPMFRYASITDDTYEPYNSSVEEEIDTKITNPSTKSQNQILRYDGTDWIASNESPGGHDMVPVTNDIATLQALNNGNDNKVINAYTAKRWSNVDVISILTTAAKDTDTIGDWEDDWTEEGASREGWLWDIDLYEVLSDDSIELEPVFDIAGSELVNLYAYRIDDEVYLEVTPVGTENPSTEGWYELISSVYTLTSDTTVQSGKTYYRGGGAVAFKFNSKIKNNSGIKVGLNLKHQRTNVKNFTVIPSSE